MSQMGRNIVVRVMLVICVLMQVAATTPHHHHGSSEAMCINPVHLFSCNDTHNRCSDKGHHHDGPITACNIKMQIVAEPDIKREETVEEISIPEHDLAYDSSDLPSTMPDAEFHSADSKLTISTRPFVRSYQIEYIATVLCSRAPNRMV